MSKYGGRSKQLTGFFRGHTWHLAMDARAQLSPTNSLVLSTHVVFKDKSNYLVKKNRQHALRRSFGRNKFNRDWRDLILAFMLAITDDEKGDQIVVNTCCKQNLVVQNFPIQYEADASYWEPTIAK